MGNKNTKQPEHAKYDVQLKNFQKLLSMGFDDDVSWKACKKYKTIEQAVQFVLNTSQNNNKNEIEQEIESQPMNDNENNNKNEIKQEIESQPMNDDENNKDIPKQNTNIVIQQQQPIECIEGYECKTVNECLGIKRMSSLIALHNKHKEEMAESFIQIIGEHISLQYNMTEILNDYIHIIKKHGDNDNNFEQLYNTLNINCNLNKCVSFQRNQRNRKNKNKIDNMMIDIIDQIHCYLLHSFDTGYRLNQNEKNLLNKEIDIKHCNDNDDTEIEASFSKMNKFLNDKRKRCNNVCNRITYSKFVTTAQKEYDYKENEKEKEEEIENNDSMITYSFSYSFNYWKQSYPLSVLPKYSSLKEELTSSTNICCVEIDEWEATKNKANTFLQTNYAKKLKASKEFEHFHLWQINEDVSLSVNNLMVIIFYTDFDFLSFKFSETFRGENVIKTIERHSNYYWFARLLRETVECYGKEYGRNDTHKYYHGVSRVMMFPSTIARFNHPTSTTQQITVAQRFATSYGCILQIGCYYQVPCFDCSWISMFANEDETLFIGGYNGLKIENIINCTNGKQYKIYLHAINQLSMCIDRNGAENATAKDIEILNLLFSDNDASLNLIPPYVLNMFRAFGKHTKRVYIDIRNINRYKKAAYFYSLLLSTTTDLQRTFVNIKNISKIFTNVEKIELSPDNDSDILLSSSYFDLVLSDLIKYPLPTLKEILIVRAKISHHSSFNHISDLLDSVKQTFQESIGCTLELIHHSQANFDYVKIKTSHFE